ncbi:MAG: amidohydrolase family protein [bacterium]|nr:amidohydrolase family protein [bacterium]
MKKNYIIGLFSLLAVLSNGQNNHIALLNAMAHIGNGEVIESSLVVIKDNKIEVVQSTKGLRLDYKSFDTVIDLAGKHIYPALINVNSILGLHDAEAVRATQDYGEVGYLNPHIRALIAYNTDNLIIPTVRSNGILYTQVTPRGGLISGSSSIMALAGWNWEDAVLKADDGIHLNYPQHVIQRKNEEESHYKDAAKRYQEDLRNLETFFTDAISYIKNPANPEKNLRYEAMRKVLSGEANLYVHVERARDMLSVINFVQKFGISKPVIVGGKDAYIITRELKNSKLPVILNRVNELPDRTDDDVDLVYRMPYLLQKDSVLFCLQMEGNMEAMNSRNLPFNAGETVAYGLTKEQALSTITLNAAKILGISHLLGSIEEGKLASLVISEGDILDMRSNNITLAYISGKKIDLTNRQNELNTKYKNKYGIK